MSVQSQALIVNARGNSDVKEAVRDGKLTLEQAIEVIKSGPEEDQSIRLRNAMDGVSCCHACESGSTATFNRLIDGVSGKEKHDLVDHICNRLGLIQIHSNVAKKTSPEDKSRKTATNGDYERWYGVYPRKCAKLEGLRAYRRAFIRLRKTMSADDVVQTLSDGARMYAKRVDPEYVCHPATWLNKGRWDDEVNAISSAASNSNLGSLESFEAGSSFNAWNG